MQHEMQLHPGPFAQMRNGKKKSELRLNDTKRQLLAVGDTILFSNRENTSEKILTRVIYLNHYPTFKELYQGVKSDYPEWEEALFIQGMYQYYTPEDEVRYGALEIGIEVIEN